ncbi:MAG: hypothetical protein ACR2NP_13650 [Pirellulaceae bacterium]
MYRYISATLVAALACLFICPDCFAQSLPAEKQAEVAFQIDMERLRGTPMYDMISANIEQMQAQTGMSSDFDWKDVNKMFGAMSLPETVAEFEEMQNGEVLNLDMFVRVQFVDSAAAEKLMTEIREEGVETEIDGQTYYSPPEDADMPPGILATLVDDKTFEMGTEAYVRGGTGSGLFSNGLTSAWDSMPEDAIRIAIDIDSARDLINEAVEMVQETAPPPSGTMVALVTKANNIRFSMDFKDGNLMTLAATGTDEDSAEELRSGLDGILGMAKFGAGQGIEQMRQQDEQLADVMTQILDALTATRDADQVQVVIPRPDGFEDAMEKLMEMSGMGGSDF